VKRIDIEQLLASPAEAAALVEVLRRGGVAGIPTETFYGIAADPFSEAGVRHVQELKRRGAEKPPLVLFASRRQLASFHIAAPASALDRFFALWPAPLTVVLPLRAPIPASCGASSLAVRMPAHEKLRALLVEVGPVTGTSLNRAGEAPCEDADGAERLFAREIDVLVDGGKTPGGLPSTVVDATAEPARLLREGAFAWPPGRP
jgi:L-threonylcarbamoyladenylate synthase